MDLEKLTEKQVINKNTRIGKFFRNHPILSTITLMAGVTVFSIGLVYGCIAIKDYFFPSQKIEYKINE